MTIGEKVERERIAANLTVGDAAEKAGKTRQQWEQWESGIRTPGYGSLELIAKTCGITLDSLVADTSAADAVEVV